MNQKIDAIIKPAKKKKKSKKGGDDVGACSPSHDGTDDVVGRTHSDHSLDSLSGS